jgi:hypothetical protein
MAHRDVTAKAAGLGSFRDGEDLRQARLALVVQMDVEALSVPLRETEDGVEMAVEIVVDAERIEAANQIAPHFHGLVEQLDGAWAAPDAALRKRHELDIDEGRPGFAQSQHGFDVAQPGHLVDVDMAAHRRRAVRQREPQKLGTASVDRPVEGSAQIFLGLDAALRGVLRAMRLPRKPEQRLVEMNMRVDQGGKHETAAEIDGSGAVRRRRAKPRYLPALDQDVCAGPVCEARIGKNKRRFRRTGHRFADENMRHRSVHRNLTAACNAGPGPHPVRAARPPPLRP